MTEETKLSIEHNIFTPGNYFYNGVGYITVHYDEVIKYGYKGLIEKAQKELQSCELSDGDYITKSALLKSAIESMQVAITYAKRYSILAKEVVKYIASGDTVFLYASTTAFYMVKELKNMKCITVVTNSIRVGNELAGLPDLRVIGVGGFVSNNQSFVGNLAQRIITENFFAKLSDFDEIDYFIT